MSHTFRSALRRKLLAAVAPALLLATTSASAPLSDADLQWYTQGFFSNASFTQKVGHGIGYCDGDYVMVSGYQTPYVRTRYLTECP